MKSQHKNRGFSLVELIVVIAIMAVLVGVLTPLFIKYIERSRMSIDVQNVELLCHSVETFAADVDRHHYDIPESCKIVLYPNTRYVVDSSVVSGDDQYWQLALENAGIPEYELKSKSWFGGSAGPIIITAHQLNGMPYFTESGVNTGLSLINGDTIDDN